jgi:hypothetical protein
MIGRQAQAPAALSGCGERWVTFNAISRRKSGILSEMMSTAVQMYDRINGEQKPGKHFLMTKETLDSR